VEVTRVERSWPDTAEDLVAEQRRLAAIEPEPWGPERGPLTVGGCWVCFPRGLTGAGAAGDPAWAAGAACCTRSDANAKLA
jgi:deoxyribonuclease V